MIRNTTLSAVACLVAFTAISLLSTDIYSQRERPSKRNDDTQTNRKSKPVDDGFLRGQISTITDSLVTDEKVADASELSSQLDKNRGSVELPTIESAPLSGQEIYAQASESVLVLSKVFKCNRCTRWHDRSSGAFAITADGIIVTNYHVVAGSQPDERTIVATTRDGRVFPVKEVITASKVNDIAVLRLELPDGESLRPLKLAEEAHPGETAYAISHPVGRFYTLTQGIVSRNAIVRAKDGRSERMFITADFAKGSSGSPILNNRGEIIGMVAATESIYYTQTQEEQKNLQMVFKNCVPSHSIRNLLKPSEDDTDESK
ncbi:MAG TPA: hypothetical protein DIT88_12635 [Planctomycetaceae bacterium]|nr:hypothetical protein [Planctomycetaceae bacterium]|tara:strand:- start:3205 stop:4158 length:954 start_codon:yes stop_codon:yes gene_type:complete